METSTLMAHGIVRTTSLWPEVGARTTTLPRVVEAFVLERCAPDGA